jgi:myo-inositol-1(or 4)-monophosphatase
MSEMNDYKRVCEQAARAGGAVLIDWVGRFAVREKRRADLVTEADLASQEVIRKTVLETFPGHGFLAEEDAFVASRDRGLRWIVDPLDGTTNYVHGVPGFVVSIALAQEDRILVGAVFDPSRNECYLAAAGEGAFLDGRRLHVSSVDCLSQALVGESFPPGIQRDDPVIERSIEVLVRCQGTRRTGSTALNLCYVAAGRFDAYWTLSTHPWDVAAGVLIVEEAGGLVSDLDGGPLDLNRPRPLAVSTAALGRELRDLLR